MLNRLFILLIGIAFVGCGRDGNQPKSITTYPTQIDSVIQNSISEFYNDESYTSSTLMVTFGDHSKYVEGLGVPFPNVKYPSYMIKFSTTNKDSLEINWMFCLNEEFKIVGKLDDIMFYDFINESDENDK